MSTEATEPKEYAAPQGTSKRIVWHSGDNEAVDVDVVAEWIVLRKKEKPAAEIFHTYYKVADAKGRRPVTFVFNGGPGAASAYLHIGGIGPQRVAFGPNGTMLPPPTRLVENSESWLVQRGHGRVPFWRFARELLKSDQKTLSYYDASVTAIDPFPDREGNEGPEPGLAGSQRLFVSGINHLLRSELNVETDRKYEILSYDVNRDWKRDDKRHVFEAPAGAIDDLRYAMSVNPHMKVLIAHGYYDMVTPYFSSERLVEQMKLLPEQREDLFIRHFHGGHMFYTWDKSRADFRDWVRQHYV